MHEHNVAELDAKTKRKVSRGINSRVRNEDLEGLCDYVEGLDKPQQAFAYFKLTSKTNSDRTLGREYVLLTAKALKAAAEEGYHLCNWEFGRFAGVIDEGRREEASLDLLANLHDTFPFYTAIACNSWVEDPEASKGINQYYETAGNGNERINALLTFLGYSFDRQAKNEVVNDLAEKYVGGEVELDKPELLLKLCYNQRATNRRDAKSQAELATKFFEKAKSEEELAQMVTETFIDYAGPFSVSFLGHWQGGARDTDLERDKNALLLSYIGGIVESAQSEELLNAASDFVFFSCRGSNEVAGKLYARLQDGNVGYDTKLRLLRGLTESGLPSGVTSDMVLSQVDFKEDHHWMPKELSEAYMR